MNTLEHSTSTGMPQGAASLLPLVDGDRLTRQEFHRRYEAMPPGKKFELIDGVVYMLPLVSHVHHGAPHFHLNAWLGFYAAHTPGVFGGDNSSLLLDDRNEVQPDGFLALPASRGGRVQFDERGYILSAPEFVLEVAASSATMDLGKKKDLYLRKEVKEYLVYRSLDKAVDWFALREGRFEPLPVSPEGWIKSESFPGLWLDVQAVVRQDLREIFRVLQLGLASQEHRAFVEG